MTSKFYSVVITSEAIYYEGKQVGRIENPDDMPRYTNYLLTPLPEEGKLQSFDWIVPPWLTRLRYDLYALAAERQP